MSRSCFQGMYSRPNQGIHSSPRGHLSTGILEFVEAGDICMSLIFHLFKQDCFIMVSLSLLCIGYAGGNGFSFCSCSLGSKKATSTPHSETVSYHLEILDFTLEVKVKTKLLLGTFSSLLQRRGQCDQHVAKGGYRIVEYQKGGL